MRFALVATGSLLLLSVAACSNTPGSSSGTFTGISATGGKPMGAASTAPTASAQMPQTPNSLPQGASVSAPVTSNVGKVGTTAY